MDSGDTPNPPGSDPPPPRKRKNVVLPKKKRRFTRTLKDEKPAAAEEEETAAAEPAEVGSVLARAHSQGAARRLTNKELTAEVKRLNEELLAAQEVIKSLQRENSSLQKRNKTLSESQTKARQDLREERKVAYKQEQTNKRKVDELEGRVLEAHSSAAAYYESELEKEKVSNSCIPFVF